MPKKTINLILISVAFIIWIIVFYNLIIGTSQEDNAEDTKVVIAADHKNRGERVDSIYAEPLMRDPFITPFNEVKPKPPVIRREVKPRFEDLPKLRLLGTLSDKDGPMAIVQFPDYTTHFVREKQKMDDFIIDKIENNKVRYRYKNNALEMSLE